ncbi:hypothetical protein [Azospirillum thermophilum]|uniref:hypothetical protein n=1 Tax=Azospirillum thermophilum TaxID=2202148 RepID=UPI0011B646EC|nr:hypothetical protein [Azospirillum thermophilum]
MTQDTRDLSAFSPADINTTVNHEPRISHLRLAEILGYSVPWKLAQLIARHLPALERFGAVSTTVVETGKRGGRKGKILWLNKRQAIYITTKSETDRATDITIAVVEVFDAAAAGRAPGLSEIEADVVGHLRRMTPAQRERLRLLAAAGDLKTARSPNAPGAAALPRPEPEPFFCTGCAARAEWQADPGLRDRAAARAPTQATYADIRAFPLLSGPLTRTEMDMLAAHRLALRDSMLRQGQDALNAVASAIGTLIGQQVIGELRREPRKDQRKGGDDA